MRNVIMQMSPSKVPLPVEDLDDFLDHESQPQTASRSIQPFFAELTSVPNRDKQTDTQTTLRATCVALGCIYALRTCDAA